MEKLIFVFLLVFSACQAEIEETCGKFEREIQVEQTVIFQDCCGDTITETGRVNLEEFRTYSFITMNCGGCGNFCNNGCLCYSESLVCECVGVTDGE